MSLQGQRILRPPPEPGDSPTRGVRDGNLDPGDRAPGPAVPPLPDEATLIDRYRLTPRQAEIALHLARGRSNLEIAEHLGISRHTARHHAQRVLEKLGAVSRKALAMKLLADREV